MDDLKKYTDDNRSEFEFFSADQDAIWDKIAAELDKTEKQNSPIILLKNWKSTAWRIAAAALLALGLGTFYFYSNSSNEMAQNSDNQKVPTELAEAERYYGSLIEQKMQIIKARDLGANELAFKNLATLDSAYADLKADLNDKAANKEVVDAMIQNYRIKLQILENILEELEGGTHENADDKSSNL
jgi:hypothetical protein